MKILNNKRGGLSHQLSVVLILLITTYLLGNFIVLSRNTNKLIKINNNRTVSIDKNIIEIIILTLIIKVKMIIFFY
ncbi:hypothetical protein EXQ39_08110 [Clostridium botulinum]|nr:hypothetical protein [Clostridium botulinum]MBO0529023.1 hypothetical protein [Clostridium botulinum]MBO0563312.1 hypothetical protein [Clostridium botulinum]